MGLSRRTRALIALAVAVPTFAVGTANAATLSSDEPVPLGSRADAPEWDENGVNMAEAFRYTASADGPVDVVNVKLDRRFVTRRASAANARLIAGIYADANGQPGALLGKGQLDQLRPPCVEHGPDHRRRAREGQALLDRRHEPRRGDHAQDQHTRARHRPERHEPAQPHRSSRHLAGRPHVPRRLARLAVRGRALQRARLHQGRDRQRHRRRRRAARAAGRHRGHVRRHRRRVQVHRRQPRQVPRGRVPQQRRRAARLGAAVRVREVLPQRRRLPRHPLGDRGRAGLAVHERPPRHPCRRAGPTRSTRRSRSPTACTSPARACRSTGPATTAGTTSPATSAASRTSSRRSTRTPTRAGRTASITRSPGARTTRAAAASTRAAAVPTRTFGDGRLPPAPRGRARLDRRQGRQGLQRLRRDRARELPADQDLGAAEHQRADRLRPAPGRPDHPDRARRAASACTTRWPARRR